MSLRASARAHHVAECEIRTDASWSPKASAPRQVMHFTPTSAAWLNMVERFFREITDERIRRDNSMSGLSLKGRSRRDQIDPAAATPVESVAIGRLSIRLTKRNLDTHKHLACPLCDS